MRRTWDWKECERLDEQDPSLDALRRKVAALWAQPAILVGDLGLAPDVDQSGPPAQVAASVVAAAFKSRKLRELVAQVESQGGFAGVSNDHPLVTLRDEGPMLVPCPSPLPWVGAAVVVLIAVASGTWVVCPGLECMSGEQSKPQDTDTPGPPAHPQVALTVEVRGAGAGFTAAALTPGVELEQHDTVLNLKAPSGAEPLDLLIGGVAHFRVPRTEGQYSVTLPAACTWSSPVCATADWKFDGCLRVDEGGFYAVTADFHPRKQGNGKWCIDPGWKLGDATGKDRQPVCSDNATPGVDPADEKILKDRARAKFTEKLVCDEIKSALAAAIAKHPAGCVETAPCEAVAR